MKKILMTSIIAIMAISQMFGMSTSKIRNHARFLSDRMAYELDLSPMQYDDVYEINFDFLWAADRIMDDVVFGYRDAIDRYYDLLDYRNGDLRFVLSSRQYAMFMTKEHFYRPIYSTGWGKWGLRVYTHYSNHSFFYFDAPTVYKHYNGGHSHHTYGAGYYDNRYHNQVHDRYDKPYKFRDQPDYRNMGHNDFGKNLKDRNNEQQNKVNNYRNRNQQHRTQDNRYQDNSGNQHSPSINNRGNSEGSNRKQGTGTNSGAASGVNSGSGASTRVQSGRR